MVSCCSYWNDSKLQGILKRKETVQVNEQRINNIAFEWNFKEATCKDRQGHSVLGQLGDLFLCNITPGSFPARFVERSSLWP